MLIRILDMSSGVCGVLRGFPHHKMVSASVSKTGALNSSLWSRGHLGLNSGYEGLHLGSKLGSRSRIGLLQRRGVQSLVTC